MKSRLLLPFLSLALLPIAQAVTLDIDGAQGEFFDYLIADNTDDIPDSSQTDGTVTLILRDESIFQWNNAGYTFFSQSEINFHPGGNASGPNGGNLNPPPPPANLAEAITVGTYYTIIVDSTIPIDISNVTLRWYRNDETGPPRRYYLLADADGNGYDTGDLIADSADFPDSVDNLIPFAHFGPAFTKEFNTDPGLDNVTQTTLRFYITNLPNLAGNTHWIYASIDYAPAAAPVIVPVGVDIAIAGPDVQVSFESLSSQSYTLEYSTDEMATWNAVPDQSPAAPVTGNDGTLTITDPGGTPAPEGKIFYRVNTTAP